MPAEAGPLFRGQACPPYGYCYITGQACGVAAAMAARAGASPRDVDVRDLQRRLVDLGGYLPNSSSQ